MNVWEIRFFTLIFFVFFFSGCATGRGAVVSDLGDRAARYRSIQEEVRSGEAMLAITGQRIEDAGREIERESGELAAGIRELEYAIAAGAGKKQEIGAVLQRIRSRRLPDNIAAEYKNRGLEGGE